MIFELVRNAVHVIELLFWSLVMPYNLLNPVSWWMAYLGWNRRNDKLIAGSIVLTGAFIVLFFVLIHPTFGFNLLSESENPYGYFFLYPFIVVLIHPIIYGLIAFALSFAAKSYRANYSNQQEF